MLLSLCVCWRFFIGVFVISRFSFTSSARILRNISEVFGQHCFLEWIQLFELDCSLQVLVQKWCFLQIVLQQDFYLLFLWLFVQDCSLHQQPQCFNTVPIRCCSNIIVLFWLSMACIARLFHLFLSDTFVLELPHVFNLDNLKKFHEKYRKNW